MMSRFYYQFSIGVLLLVMSGLVLASSCPKQTEKELFERAKQVLLAKVISTRIFNVNVVNVTEVVEAEFETIEVFKNSKDKVDSVHNLIWNPGGSHPPLMSGANYVFFVQQGGPFASKGDESWNFVGHCTGSYIINLEATGINEDLDELRRLGKDT